MLQTPSVRLAIVLLVDGAITTVSLWIALLLRFEGDVASPYDSLAPTYLAWLVCARIAASWLFRLHRWSFRLSGLTDGARVVMAGIFGTGLFVLTLYFLRVLLPPRSVIVLELFVSTAGMTAVRFAPRLAWMYWTELSRTRRGHLVRTLIIGGGAAGEMLFRDLQRSHEHDYRVVGFLDDKKAKQGTIIAGRPVLGTVDDLPQVVAEHRITNVLIAIPRLEASKLRELLSLCAGLKVHIKILPVSFVNFRQRASRMLQDISPEDLLPREQVSFVESDRATVRGRRVMVTGAAGSIGGEICRQLTAADVGELIAVDINENNLYLLEHELRQRHPKAKLVTQLADIRDAGRVESLMRRFKPQDVFHASAHKHVPLVEAAPCEAIKNNVLGTSHVLAAAERAGVECFVFISTDKAVMPSSVMGATKRVGEMLTRAIGRRSSMRCCAVRFGNVLGSQGSVVPLFQQQIAAGGPVTITDREARRYFMTIREAVGLVLRAGYHHPGELCVLDMGDPIPILDLARHLITMAGLVPDVDIPIVITGLRPGEKLTEQLLTEDEESAVKSDGKIHVVEAAPPPADLWQRITLLKDAAYAEDAERTLELLRDLVPSYRSPGTPVAEGQADQPAGVPPSLGPHDISFRRAATSRPSA
jgi:FlaA1/EpsC-like NDP-sugar epimerase